MNTNVNTPQACPNCSQPLPAGALAGLCPACLMAQGLESADQAGPARRFEPPAVAEIARLFPQLEILQLLGAGGMGAVYQARQPALDRMVALKVLPADDPAGGSGFRERFHREARALARLNHPNIVAVHEFGDAGGLHYFLMEFVDGANLRQLQQAERISPREALQIIPQICDALQYAHDEGVVHRDIKPENVLVDRRGRVKIADFGLAKIAGTDAGASRLTGEGQVMGTPHYMAPEQVEHPLAVDHRADIYSLGVVFYELLTGDLPLGKFPAPSRKVSVDVRLDDIVLRSLENDPARRYQHASEVKSQVEAVAAAPAPGPGAEAFAGGKTTTPTTTPLRWAGFPLVDLRAGKKAVAWREVLRAAAILFGLASVAFGMVTLFTGESLWGWLGVIGWKSVVARLALVGGLVGIGTGLALTSNPAPPAPPPTAAPLFPVERFSRKAIAGAALIPVAVLCLLSWVVTVPVARYQEATIETAPARIDEPAAPGAPAEAPAPARVVPPRSPGRGTLAAAIAVLGLGLTAPLATTILGWMAVGEIRRARGRIAGLPLAVFDGLFPPLLLLDALIYAGWHAFAQAAVERAALNSNPAPLIAISGLTVVGLIDFLIVRQVWRLVRLEPGGSGRPAVAPGWWTRIPGPLAVGVACVILAGTGVESWMKRSRNAEGPTLQVADQVASNGVWSAGFPGGVRLELIAVGGRLPVAPQEWWRASGVPVVDEAIIVDPRDRLGAAGMFERTVLFRLASPSDPFTALSLRAGDSANRITSGPASIDGQPVNDARVAHLSWPHSRRSADLDVGVAVLPWQTVVSLGPTPGSRAERGTGGAAPGRASLDKPVRRNGESGVTSVHDAGAGSWEWRTVAVDHHGEIHTASSFQSSTARGTVTATHGFPLDLAAIKEFRLEARPIHWVRFPSVALEPRP